MDITLPTQEEIHDAYQSGEESVQQLFATVSAHVEQVALHLQELHEVIQRLQDQVKKNRSNSSKPPSSDGLKKPRTTSLRSRGKRLNGGQKGHQGHPLRQGEHPDHTKVHDVQECRECHACLQDIEAQAT